MVSTRIEKSHLRSRLNDSEIVDDGGAETMRFFKNLFVEKSREVDDSWWEHDPKK
jgi:hypothetical protein